MRTKPLHAQDTNDNRFHGGESFISVIQAHEGIRALIGRSEGRLDLASRRRILR